jgi:hypothetical protein
MPTALDLIACLCLYAALRGFRYWLEMGGRPRRVAGPAGLEPALGVRERHRRIIPPTHQPAREWRTRET